MHRNRIFIGVELKEAFDGTSNPIICSLGSSSKHLAIAYDGHHHFHEVAKKGAGRCISIQNLDFVSMAYCEQHHVLFVLSTDGSICVYSSRDLHYITRIPMGLRHAMQICYVNRTKELLVWMPSELLSLTISISTNQKTARFASAVFFMMQETARRSLAHPSFMRSLRIQKEEYLVMYNPTDVMVYNCAAMKPLANLKELVVASNQLNCVAISPAKNYLLLGCQNGRICVYQLNNNRHLVNELEGHRKRVLALLVNKQETEMLSYGEDQTIRITSLGSLLALEVFETGKKFHKFEFLNEQEFIACENSTTFTGQISSKLELLFEHRSQLECRADRQGGPDVMVLTNNTMLSITEEDLAVVSGYTPPNCKQVLQISRNPYVSDQQYWLLTSDKELYAYRINSTKENSFSVLAVHPVKNFVNLTGNINAFDLLTFQFVRIAPLRFDAEITESIHLENDQTVDEFQGLALGSNRGDIVIVGCRQLTSIQSRVRFHKEPIERIEQIVDHNRDTLMLTMCKGKRIVVSRFSPREVPSVVTQLDLNEHFLRMFFDSEYIILTYWQGIFDVCEYDNGEIVTRRTKHPQIQHEAAIIFASVSRKDSRLVTSSLDQTVKVWTLEGAYLFEVAVGRNVDWARFADDKLLLFVNGSWLTWLSAVHYHQYLQDQPKELLPQLTEKALVRIQPSQQSILTLPLINSHRQRATSNRKHTQSRRRRHRDHSQLLLNRQHSGMHDERVPKRPVRSRLEGYESYFHLPDPLFLVKLTGRLPKH